MSAQGPDCATEEDFGQQQVDVTELLAPPGPKERAAAEHSPEDERLGFIVWHRQQKPLIDNRLEYFSSKAERRRSFALRTTHEAGKKAAQRRIRIIILADIVLFILILGVIYPALKRLQTTGKLSGYRFSVSQAIDKKQNQLNILIKAEHLASVAAAPGARYRVTVSQSKQRLLQDQGFLPTADSPVNYSLFPISLRLATAEAVSVAVQIDKLERKFVLRLPEAKDIKL